MTLYIKYLWWKYIRWHNTEWKYYKEFHPWSVKKLDNKTKLEILRNPEIKKMYSVSMIESKR